MHNWKIQYYFPHPAFLRVPENKSPQMHHQRIKLLSWIDRMLFTYVESRKSTCSLCTHTYSIGPIQRASMSWRKLLVRCKLHHCTRALTRCEKWLYQNAQRSMTRYTHVHTYPPPHTRYLHNIISHYTWPPYKSIFNFSSWCMQISAISCVNLFIEQITKLFNMFNGCLYYFN